MSLITQLAKTATRWGIAKKSSGGGLLKTGAGFLATRVATRSIPGAVVVGGAMLAKHLWDRKRAKAQGMPAEPTVDHDALAVKETAARNSGGETNHPAQIREIGRVN